MLLKLAFFSEILPIILYLCFLKRNRGEGLWVIFLYCCISLLSEVLVSILQQTFSPFFIYSSFDLIEYALFSLFFYLSIKGKKFKYIPIFGAFILFTIAIFGFSSKNQGDFDTVSASIEAILIISYCILVLYEEINDPEIIFVYNTKKFWVIIAFFLYFSSTLFLFSFAKTLTQKEHDKWWTINNFFEILKNILFSISFIMKKSNNKPYVIEEL